MFSRILIKLIDEAIIPAIVLVATRFLSVILLAKVYEIPFEFGASGFVYGTRTDFIFINSYSTLAMICILAIGLIYILVKSHVFHDTHVKPHISAKLFSFKLSSFIQTSFDVYSQGAIWWLYSLLILIATGIMSYFGLIYPWVMWASLALTLIGTYMLIIDVEEELEVKKKNSGSDIDDAEGRNSV
jgi:hypothetical protein